MNSKILRDIQQERDRQEKLFGKQPRNLKPTFYLTILTEELGEVARAIVDGDSEEYRDELIQLAAVAVAAVEEFDSGTATNELESVCRPITYQTKSQQEFMSLSDVEEAFVDLIRSALDEDFVQAILTGSYGSRYQSLIEELNSGLENRKMNLSEDFLRIKISADGDSTKTFSLEDLNPLEQKHIFGFLANSRYHNKEKMQEITKAVEVTKTEPELRSVPELVADQLSWLKRHRL